MPEEAKKQMVALAASMHPVAAVAPMRPHDPNWDGPFGEPFAPDTQQIIDPNLEKEDTV